MKKEEIKNKEKKKIKIIEKFKALSPNKKFYLGIFMFFFLMFLLTIYFSVLTYFDYKEANEVYNQTNAEYVSKRSIKDLNIEEAVVEPIYEDETYAFEQEEGEAQEPIIPNIIQDATKSIRKYDIDFKDLKKQNEDSIAWVIVGENAEVSYPILQGEDNEYYLKHTIDNKNNSSGSIFLDYRNNNDFSDRNSVIYGHNMKNKTMFSKIKQYMDESYYKNNPYFYIYTEDYTYQYEILSCYVLDTLTEQTIPREFSSSEEYKNFILGLREKALYKTTLTNTKISKLCTLVTCYGSSGHKRCLVTGSLVSKEKVS